MSSSTYTAVYAFGDSLSDAGNADLLTTSKLLTSTLASAILGDPGESLGSALGAPPEPISPPYASEIYGSVTADVFSNGPVWVQDLSEALGLGQLEPSGLVVTAEEVADALDLSVTVVEKTVLPLLADLGDVTISGTFATLAAGGNGTGSATDFAIGGSVTGPTPANAGAQVALTDLSAQYATFLDEVGTPQPDALYTVWSGSNDVLDLLDGTLDAATEAADISQSVTQELDFIGTLIAGGAENLLVVTVPDIGLAPAGQANAATASGLAMSYDAQLVAGLAALDQAGVTITVLDSYSLLDGAVADPSAYGLTNVTDPLWTGNFEGQDGTLSATGTAAAGYLFFDQLHPTEQGQALIADAALAALGIPCYVRGTRLDTPHGPRPIESLRGGDLVRTRDGLDQPVVWVGRREIDIGSHPRPGDVWPVCFRAGALADGVPRRDLWVSPAHAMFLDDVLIPAELLVNGVSVVRQEVAQVAYFHVELEHHDIVLAEGAPAESFVDRESRMMFENADPALLARRKGRPFCAPRIEDGPALEAVRRRVAARAGLDADHVEDADLPGPLEGRVDELDLGCVSGWAFDPARPHTPVVVEVLVDGTAVARCVANQYREDLLAAGKGAGRCGFTCRLPTASSPDIDHVVRVRRACDAAPLRAGPERLFADPAAPGALEGRIDVCNAVTVEGWALDVEHPDIPVRLEVMEDDRVLGVTLASRYRPDLERAGLGLGRCSFVFRFSRAADVRLVWVRRARDGVAVGSKTPSFLKKRSKKLHCLSEATG